MNATSFQLETVALFIKLKAAASDEQLAERLRPIVRSLLNKDNWHALLLGVSEVMQLGTQRFVTSASVQHLD